MATADRSWQRLRAARRPVIFAGQGAQGAAGDVRRLAHAMARARSLFTSSGTRCHCLIADALAFVQDFSFGVGDGVARADRACRSRLALGCKFTHNGSAAGRLQLPAEKLVRVDSSADVLAANYPASQALCRAVEDVVPAMRQAGTDAAVSGQTDELDRHALAICSRSAQ